MSDIITNKPILRQSVKFGERYVSSALNRKLAGIVGTGVYHGFVVKPGGIGKILVTHEDDYPCSVAVIERNNYNLTITMDDAGYVELPSAGTFYICIEAFYIETEAGYQHIVVRETPENHHIVLAKVTIDNITRPVEESDIDANICQYVSQRSIDVRLAKLYNIMFKHSANQIDLNNRLFNAEMKFLKSTKTVVIRDTTSDAYIQTEEVLV